MFESTTSSTTEITTLPTIRIVRPPTNPSSPPAPTPALAPVPEPDRASTATDEVAVYSTALTGTQITNYRTARITP